MNQDLKELLSSPKVFDFIFNDKEDNKVKEILVHYTKAKDFIKEDVWRYRFYFTKWDEYVNVYTQYDPVIDTLIYLLDDRQIPNLNSNYLQQL